MDKGLLIVLSGPSGTGKGTVCQKLCRQNPLLYNAVSLTTRPPREGEKDKVHYYFLSKGQFEELIDKGALLEWAQVYGNYYGTPVQEVEEKRRQGFDVILEIDTQGAKQIRRKARDAVLIFLLPPSMEELWHRIRGRGTDEPEAMKERFAAVCTEMKEISHYDYVVINEDVAEAAKKIEAIIVAEKCCLNRNKKMISRLLEEGGKFDLPVY